MGKMKIAIYCYMYLIGYICILTNALHKFFSSPAATLQFAIDKICSCHIFKEKLHASLSDIQFLYTGLDLVKDAITANGNNVFWEKIFTDKDVDISAQQYQEILMEKRKKLDQSSMYD